MRGHVQQLQPDQILPRVEHPVAVVDPQPRHFPARQQPANHPVRRRENLRVLHAQPGQIVDVEKSPVIDLLARYAPERESVGCVLQQTVQAIETPRIAFHAVNSIQRPLQRRPHLFARERLLQTRPQFRQLLPPLRHQRRVHRLVRRNVRGVPQNFPERLRDAQLIQFLIRKDQWDRPRRNGNQVIEILHHQPPVGHHHLNPLRLQLVAVLRPQNRQQQLVLHVRIQRAPVNVEIARVFRRPPVLQHILPPLRIVPHTHVVGHDIQQQSHAQIPQPRREAREPCLAAQLRIQAIVPRHVVAVHAPGRASKIGDA